MQTKICLDCRRELPITEFDERTDTPDKHNDQCHDCVKKWRAYLKEHPDKKMEQYWDELKNGVKHRR
jgi:hypothetical protein